MRGIARINDITFGICKHPSHLPKSVKGKIITGSNDTSIDNRPVARANDIVLTDCGHYDYIITYRADLFVNSRQVARLNDKVGKNGIYDATIITASDKTSTL